MADKKFTVLIDEIKMSIEELAERIGLILERKLVEAIDQAQMVATGDTRKSASHEVIKETALILIRGFLGTNYAIFPSEGTRPHFPPIEPIARWVKLRGIGQSFSLKSHRMTGTRKRNIITVRQGIAVYSEEKFSREVLSVAYAIARGISKRGIRGRKIFQIALQKAESDITKLVLTT